MERGRAGAAGRAAARLHGHRGGLGRDRRGAGAGVHDDRDRHRRARPVGRAGARERYRMGRCVDDLAALLRAPGTSARAGSATRWVGGPRCRSRCAVPTAVVRAHPRGGDARDWRRRRSGRARARRRGARAEDRARRASRRSSTSGRTVAAVRLAAPSVRAAPCGRGGCATGASGLANSLRGMGTGAQEAARTTASGDVACPALLLPARSMRSSPRSRGEMARVLPDATMHMIDDAGHAAHLERPDVVPRDGARVPARRACAATAGGLGVEGDRLTIDWRRAGSTPTSCTRRPTASRRSRSTAPRCTTRSVRETLDEMMACVRGRTRRPAASASCCCTGAGGRAFCSGGDQRVRGEGGYVGGDGVPRLNVLSCSATSARCRSRSSPSSRGTPSVAGTCCTSSAT